MVAHKLPEDSVLSGEVELQSEESQPEEPQAEGRIRARTMSRKEMARDIRRRRLLGDGLLDEEEQDALRVLDANRPRVRPQCEPGSELRPNGEPCGFFSCKFNLYLDVNPETGSVKLNFPDKEFWELEETCALDVADRGGITLEEVGAAINTTRERVRQVETLALLKLRAAVEGKSVEELQAGDAAENFEVDAVIRSRLSLVFRGRGGGRGGAP